MVETQRRSNRSRTRPTGHDGVSMSYTDLLPKSKKASLSNGSSEDGSSDDEDNVPLSALADGKTRPSPPENGHFSSSLKLGPSKRINAYGSNDESLKVWLDYSNFFLPYDVLVVGWKFGGHGWLSHVL